jgi:hypothetical protein
MKAFQSLRLNQTTMKPLLLFWLCFIIGSSTTPLSAQEPLPHNANQTGAVPFTYVWEGFGLPIYSEEGLLIDNLQGTVTAHSVVFWNHGELMGANETYDGEVTSELTGETFEIRVSVKATMATQIAIMRYSLKGDQGTYYVGAIEWHNIDYENGIVELRPLKIVWPGNKHGAFNQEGAMR